MGYMVNIIERAKQDGSKVWQVTWRDDEGRQIGETFDNEADAETYKAELSNA